MPATFTATIEKTRSTAPVVGAYASTAVDARKAAADIRITSCGSTTSMVFSKLALKGRGIRAFNVDAAGIGFYDVTDVALDKLRGIHRVECDF